MYSVYVLFSKKDKEVYVGYSRDARKRFREHTQGKVAATRLRRPLILVYCELFRNRTDAIHREQYLKTGWGRNYLRKTLRETLKELGSKI